MELVVGASQATMKSILGKLGDLLAREYALVRGVRGDIQYINDELTSMQAFLINLGTSGADDHDAQTKDWMKQIRDVAYDIGDCMDDSVRRLPDDPRGGGCLAEIRLRTHELWMCSARRDIAAVIADLKFRVREIGERRIRYGVRNPDARGGHMDARSVGFDAAEDQLATTQLVGIKEPGPSSSTPFLPMMDLKVMEERKRELLDLVLEEEDGRGLKVISIVGFHGLGKTALAMEVYRSLDDKRFSCRTWVDASKHKDGEGVLTEIFRNVTGESSRAASSAAQQNEDLRTYLQKQQRFVIVLKSVQPRMWKTIEHVLCVEGGNGQIIVITNVNSIAHHCSSQARYIYRMQALNDDQSKELFKKTVNLDKVSESILNKCAGVPLAIAGVAQLLSSNKDVSKELIYLRSNPFIQRLKQVMIQSYRSLHPALQVCFLSLSMFPEGHVIKMKSLLRRWSAEGFARERRDDYDARAYSQELLDCNLIKPIEIGNNGNVKTCQIHGIMFDFVVHIAIKENFCALVHNDKLLQGSGRIRRFSFHSISAESGKIANNIDLSHIRSLSIFGHDGGGDLVAILNHKWIRVLDLENCKGLKDNFLEGVCELFSLKYLSLRNTDVRKLPKKISKLHCLSTLDIRGTLVDMLPLEVLTLPKLANLFGRFQLPSQLRRSGRSHRLQRFFSDRSKLQTLAGFLMNDSPGFEVIMAHLHRLRKVKIWSEKTPNCHFTDILISCFQKRFVGNYAFDSLSVDFGNESIDFMEALKVRCIISSIKLKGHMTTLPSFILLSDRLVELCLSSNYLRCEDLSKLQALPSMRYLKLVCQKLSDGSFSVTPDGFRNLCRLWIQSHKLPQVSIAAGGMRELTSLTLLCEDVGGLATSTIHVLGKLTEIMLGDVGDETRTAWVGEAKRHRNRPTIL